MGSTWDPPNHTSSSSAYSYTNGAHAPSQPSYMNGTAEPQPPPAPMTGDPNFDILEWHPAYQSCQQYFVDVAQYEQATQALCALINIRLPFQWLNSPVTSSQPQGPPSSFPNSSFTFSPFPTRPGSNTLPGPSPSRNTSSQSPPTFVSLVPYIRRLVVTAFDKAPILHGLFGDDYVRGVLPHVECERRNYLFAAKHGGWRSCKKQYDVGSGGGGDESVPFLKPLDEAKMEELTAAEKAWSGWLAMEDWMVGPRAPEDTTSAESSQGQHQPHGGEGRQGNANHTHQLPDGI